VRPLDGWLSRARDHVLNVVMLLQRHSQHMPAWLRRIATAVRRRYVSLATTPGIPDWTIDLRGRPQLDWPADPAPKSSTTAVLNGQASNASTDHCVLMAQDLDVGGLAEVVLALAESLPQLGFRVSVVVPTSRSVGSLGQVSASLEARGVAVSVCDEAALTAHLRALDADVIYMHGAPDWARRMAVDGRAPVVETLHGAHDLFGERAETVAARFSGVARVVAVSETVRQQFRALCPSYPESRTVTVPNAAHTPHDLDIMSARKCMRQRLGISDDFLFLSLSRFCLQKNPYGLVSAFNNTRSHGRLLIAGRVDDEFYAEQVRRRAQASPSGRVHLRSNCQFPWQLLAAADAFVLDSFFEGWALASMQALTLGVPVILSDVGGAREQLTIGTEVGTLVANPLGDPLLADWDRIRASRFIPQVNSAELTGAMNSMISQAELWAACREAIRAAAIAAFSPTRWLGNQVDVLSSAMDEKSVA